MRILTEWLFPPKCAACGSLLDWSQKQKGAFCKGCYAVFQSEKKATCGICALPVDQCLCMPEAMQKAGGEGLCKAVYYLHGNAASIQNRVIFFIKRNRTRRVFRFLAEELTPHLSALLADPVMAASSAIITFVPRRRQPYLEFGVDQAKELAKEIGISLALPTVAVFAQSRHHRKPQKRLTVRERFREVKKAYRLQDSAEVVGKTVVLVDDMVTTGATMAACIRLLKQGGAKHVICASVALDDINQESRAKSVPSEDPVFDGTM